MKVLFSRSAQADITAIFEYIARDNPIAARHVVAAIERSTNLLSQYPYSGRMGAVENTRELVIPRLPYVVVYQIAAEAVEVIAVFHAAQNRPRGKGD